MNLTVRFYLFSFDDLNMEHSCQYSNPANEYWMDAAALVRQSYFSHLPIHPVQSQLLPEVSETLLK